MLAVAGEGESPSLNPAVLTRGSGRGGGIGYSSGPPSGENGFGMQPDSGYGGGAGGFGGSGGGYRGDLKRDSGHGGYDDRDTKRMRY